jgi:NADH:ubiquinone reductase (H+-translocating)
VLSRIAGEQPTPINVGFAGLCISLGRRAATAQFAFKDDTANRFYIGGRLAAKIKEIGSKGLTKELADEARKPGSYSWFIKDDKRQHRLQIKRGEAPTTAEQAA